MRKTILTLTLAAALGTTANAHAFLGSLVSIGIQAGGELVRAAGGAAVDAVKDSMRDPEAEARKKAENERKLALQMQKQIDEIDARTELRPIDRERLILQLKHMWKQSSEMQAFVERAEEQQKAERSQLLTVGGIAGVVGQAALNSTGMVVAQANLATKNPVWRAEQRLNTQAVLRQADMQVAAGVPQAKTRLVLAQADALNDTGAMQAGNRAVMDNMHELSRLQHAAHEANAVKQATLDAAALEPGPSDALIAPPEAPPQAASGTPVEVSGSVALDAQADGRAEPEHEPDAFSPDLGRVVWIEFEGSPTETATLRQLLQARGHTLTDDRDAAEVAYLFQGEFSIPETKLHDGLTVDAGGLLENPSQTVERPSRKTMGAISSGLGRFMLGAAGAPAPAVQDGGYTQRALLVIARQPKGGKETRVSVVQRAQGSSIEAARLAKAALQDMYLLLGI